MATPQAQTWSPFGLSQSLESLVNSLGPYAVPLMTGVSKFVAPGFQEVGPTPSGVLPRLDDLGERVTASPAGPAAVPTALDLPQGSQADPQMASLDSPQVGVQGPAGRRPGIRTTIYRAEPGTREFVLDSPDTGLEIPGARAQLEDHLNYQMQILDAYQGAGGTAENSPQVRGLMANIAAGQQALAQRTSADAQMMGAEKGLTFPQVMTGVLAQQGGLTPSRQLAVGMPGVDPRALAQEYGLAGAGVAGGAKILGSMGKWPLTPGSPEAQAYEGANLQELQDYGANRPFGFGQTVFGRNREAEGVAANRYAQPRVVPGPAAGPRPDLTPDAPAAPAEEEPRFVGPPRPVGLVRGHRRPGVPRLEKFNDVMGAGRRI